MKTDWKDDIFAKRKIRLTDNGDGTVTPEDETDYTQQGDALGAKELNEIGAEVNETASAVDQFEAEVQRLGESVGNGKSQVAAAITAKGQPTAADAAFSAMAANIGKIETESVLTGNAHEQAVLAGYTFYSTNPKSKQAGAMPNNGAVSQALTLNGTYGIPAGYHNGSGRVTQSIPVQGGSTTTPGTANKVAVAANRYVTGDIVVAGSGNLVAGNIKKGVNIFGVTGTWEGYVPTASDLYLRGNNIAGFVISSTESNLVLSFDSGQITMTGLINLNLKGCITSNTPINLTGYNKVNIEAYVTNYKGTSSQFRMDILPNKPASSASPWSAGTIAWVSSPITSTGAMVVSLDISVINAARYIAFGVVGINVNIYRVWLS